MLILNKAARVQLINNKVLMRKISVSAHISLQYPHEDKAGAGTAAEAENQYILMEVQLWKKSDVQEMRCTRYWQRQFQTAMREK